jgi:hypothetical protein
VATKESISSMTVTFSSPLLASNQRIVERWMPMPTTSARVAQAASRIRKVRPGLDRRNSTARSVRIV